MTVIERFLKYVSFDTQSDENSGATPSTPKQMVFAQYLRSELEQLGFQEISLDENGYLSDETIANRASDALLNYMEACYEKNGNLDAKAQSYWRAFRERAHPDTDYNKTIAATVMSEEAKNDWGEERLITLGNWSIQPCITSIG